MPVENRDCTSEQLPSKDICCKFRDMLERYGSRNSAPLSVLLPFGLNSEAASGPLVIGIIDGGTHPFLWADGQERAKTGKKGHGNTTGRQFGPSLTMLSVQDVLRAGKRR